MEEAPLRALEFLQVVVGLLSEVKDPAIQVHLLKAINLELKEAIDYVNLFPSYYYLLGSHNYQHDNHPEESTGEVRYMGLVDQ